MKGASRLSPARVRHRSSVLSRLLVCLALLYGCGHAVSEETDRGLDEIDVAERVADRMEGIGTAVEGNAGVDVVDCHVKAEGECGESGPPVTEVDKTAVLVDEGAGEVVDQAVAATANIGECSGKRFKKCR